MLDTDLVLCLIFVCLFVFKMVEMVCLHVISLMEALQECNSTIFVKVGIPHHEYLVNDVAAFLL